MTNPPIHHRNRTYLDKHESSWHAHKEGQLFIVQSGLLLFELKDRRILIPSGQAGWVPSPMLHKGKSIGPVTCDLIYIDERFCRVLKEAFVFTPTTLLKEIVLRIAKKKSFGSLLPVLMDEITSATRAPLSLPMPMDKQLEKIAKSFVSNPGVNQTIEAWVKSGHLSKRTFTRRFREETGMSFAQWCQQVRVMQALQYLAKDKSITWIAFTLGYNSVSAFIKVFRQWMGVTPGRYLIP